MKNIRQVYNTTCLAFIKTVNNKKQNKYDMILFFTAIGYCDFLISCVYYYNVIYFMVSFII